MQRITSQAFPKDSARKKIQAKDTSKNVPAVCKSRLENEALDGFFDFIFDKEPALQNVPTT